MSRLCGLVILDEKSQRMIYGPDELREIGGLVNLLAEPMTRVQAASKPELLRDADVLFSGWGGPTLSRAFLSTAPKLRAVFYGAGSLASIVTDAAWERGLTITSALHANAVPVAEYTLATILFSLKHGWRHTAHVRTHHNFADRDTAPGCYRTTVGLVGLGTIGRLVLKLLRHFDLNVIVYDPFLTAREAATLGVQAVTLDDVFARANVVSLHAPALAETAGMVTGERLARLGMGATFINTARAELVVQDELIEVARRRPDLQFVLDVVSPEPPEPTSPLYGLSNVVLTPHLAGSVGQECRRMGRFMVEELRRYLAGEPLSGAVRAETIWNTSHRPFYASDGSLLGRQLAASGV
ncbi:MAG: hydroxyacid dehydrogenase [Tepidisphaeraceae bacterium]